MNSYVLWTELIIIYYQMLKHVWSVINIVFFFISKKLSMNMTILNVRHENLITIGVFLHSLDTKDLFNYEQIKT